MAHERTQIKPHSSGEYAAIVAQSQTRLEAERKLAGLSVTDVSDRTGLSTLAVIRLERGIPDYIRGDHAAELVKLFKKPIAALRTKLTDENRFTV